MQSHILSRGYDFCRKEDFKHLVDNSDILISYMVDYKMNIQNVFSAEKFFWEIVEGYMRDHGCSQTSQFTRIVRMWHQACDVSFTS